jgi:hypothetical protein
MDEGPFLAVAVFRDPVGASPDGRLHLEGIVQGVQTRAQFGPYGEGVAVRTPLQIVLVFNSGGYRGRKAVEIRPCVPGIAGHRDEIEFQGEDRMASLVIGFDFTFLEPGVHWFDVLLGDRWMTRMSIRADFKPLQGLAA